MQDRPTRRRFIAGAVCPRCGKMDKIVVNLDTDQRECVACDFSEARPQPDTDSQREIHTRVSRAAARRVETPAEAVTLVDKGKKAQ
ncbi:MAG: YheV family putative metal-binding protein [Haliea sp.]|nr:YheV family putative metal-binding protein [Haliea sp.]